MKANNKKLQKVKTLVVRLDNGLYEKVTIMAAKDRRTLSDFVRIKLEDLTYESN